MSKLLTGRVTRTDVVQQTTRRPQICFRCVEGHKPPPPPSLSAASLPEGCRSKSYQPGLVLFPKELCVHIMQSFHSQQLKRLCYLGTTPPPPPFCIYLYIYISASFFTHTVSIIKEKYTLFTIGIFFFSYYKITDIFVVV